MKLPQKNGERLDIGKIRASAASFMICSILEGAQPLMVVVTKDQQSSAQLAAELSFFCAGQDMPIAVFPDWETLPYDHFSPHKDILSQRLSVLSRLSHSQRGILIVSVTTLMHRLAPRQYIDAHCFALNENERLNIPAFLERLQNNGYQRVSQVMEHGEYSIRGSIIDLFPMGSEVPYRIDLLDDEIDSIRIFDVDTQRTIKKVEQIALLPAREFPLNQAGIDHFRQAFRKTFDVNPADCMVYQSISKQQVAAGIEYYLPLFFDQTETLLDYLPENSLIVRTADLSLPIADFNQKIHERYEQLRFDVTRPLLPPKTLFLNGDEVFGAMKSFRQIQFHETEKKINLEVQPLPHLTLSHKPGASLKELEDFLNQQTSDHSVLFCVETPGRREMLLNLLKKIGIEPTVYPDWPHFLNHRKDIGVMVSPLAEGFTLVKERITFIAESQLLGEKVQQQRMRSAKYRDVGTLIRNLNELEIGDPVVHIEHGVGRYLGLQVIQTDDLEMECLVLEYANASKLYVPVSSLHLINRFSGVDVDHAPLHALGSKQWEKAKDKALTQIKDVAVELLDIYAKRESKSGFVYEKPQDYEAFADGFPFEETPDQENAIDQVLQDMTSSRYMDRLICGDVGFGKTEVAMRAAFIAAQNHKQVAVLVPTTVLAEQHYQNFKNRFADWPIKIASISRFSQAAQQKEALTQLKAGKVDIIIGTHRLLQPSVVFHDLGLLIIDEEHRFGVTHKEKIKSKKSEVDILTLSATPIPRTLNMAMNGIWDMSVIATPPTGRLAVKTFVQRYEDSLVKEAILRENLRGGQVYFVHNRVETIERAADKLRTLIPELKVGIAHGQMPENQLERVMADFYHQRFNVLLCTTIIESGIDVPTANTMIIERADCFGMAQLHQLRGRVGRSHHQAYAYLLMPEEAEITVDAKKRLEALAQIEDLGAGFNLASHDLEIRGAGELLGEEQSGHIQTIGFSLYAELLEQAVTAMKSGKGVDFKEELERMRGTEVDLRIPALIPDIYVPDIHTRLVLYKRIASSKNREQLDELHVELIDRFGFLPEATQNLLNVTELKLKAQVLGIEKLTVGAQVGKIHFSAQSEHPSLNVDALIGLIQKFPQQYQLKGGQLFSFSLTDTSPAGKFNEINALLDKMTLTKS